MFNRVEYVIVGVVPYLEYTRADGAERPWVFFPAAQPGNRLLVRVAANAGTMLPTLRREIASVDPRVPISEEMTLADSIASMFMPVKLASEMLGYASLLGLLLSGIGLHGLLACSVTQRTREMATRLAMGALPRDVVRLVVREALRPVLAGIVVGTLAALVSTRLLVRYLYGVSQTDWLTFAAGPAVLIVIAALAAYFPARRAASTSPLAGLRIP